MVNRSLTPVHKGGSRNDPKNYRGITVLNGIGKIFTSILYSMIMDWAEESFVDKKVFESINHTLLWSCLSSIGVSQRILAVLQSMYASASSCIRISSS